MKTHTSKTNIKAQLIEFKKRLDKISAELDSNKQQIEYNAILASIPNATDFKVVLNKLFTTISYLSKNDKLPAVKNFIAVTLLRSDALPILSIATQALGSIGLFYKDLPDVFMTLLDAVKERKEAHPLFNEILYQMCNCLSSKALAENILIWSNAVKNREDGYALLSEQAISIWRFLVKPDDQLQTLPALLNILNERNDTHTLLNILGNHILSSYSKHSYIEQGLKIWINAIKNRDDAHELLAIFTNPGNQTIAAAIYQQREMLLSLDISESMQKILHNIPDSSDTIPSKTEPEEELAKLEASAALAMKTDLKNSLPDTATSISNFFPETEVLIQNLSSYLNHTGLSPAHENTLISQTDACKNPVDIISISIII